MTAGEQPSPTGAVRPRPGAAPGTPEADIEYWDKAYLAALVDGRNAAARAALLTRDAIKPDSSDQEES